MKYLLSLVLLLGLGCQKSPSKLEQWIQPNGKIKVMSTTAMIDDIVGQVGGDRIDHIALIEGAMDPHSYELVKGDDEKFSYAKVIFYNGLGLEHGASLRYHLQTHSKAIALGDKLRAENPEAILTDRGQVDPHIWLDVSLWAKIVDPIVEALSEADPQNRDYFYGRGIQVKESLSQLDNLLIQKIGNISAEKRYLVTSHDAFNYFTRRYLNDGTTSWKDRFCAPEGLAPDGQLSCHDIQLVIDHLLKHQIGVIFSESHVSKESLNKILSVCREKKMDVKIAKAPLHSDTLGEAEGTYQTMMLHNAEVLCEAWQ